MSDKIYFIIFIILLIIGYISFLKASKQLETYTEYSDNLFFGFGKNSLIKLLFLIFCIGNMYIFDQVYRGECSIKGWEYDKFPWIKFIVLSFIFITYYFVFIFYYKKRESIKIQSTNDYNKEDVREWRTEALKILINSLILIAYFTIFFDCIFSINYSEGFFKVLGSIVSSIFAPILVYLLGAIAAGFVCIAIFITLLPAILLTKLFFRSGRIKRYLE